MRVDRYVKVGLVAEGGIPAGLPLRHAAIGGLVLRVVGALRGWWSIPQRGVVVHTKGRSSKC